MRCLSALSILILLSTSIAGHQSSRLHLDRCETLMTNGLSRVELPINRSLRRGTPQEQASAREGSAPQNGQETNSLEPGQPIERELSGGQTHTYKIAMIPGQYTKIVVEQRGVDVTVLLINPEGRKIREADSEKVIERSESVSAIAEFGGEYLIEVRSTEKSAKTGHYVIKIEYLRTASVEDKYRVDGESLFREAEKLQDGTMEDRRRSIEKYQKALGLYRRANDLGWEAQTLKNIGNVYFYLSEYQKVLETEKEALPISQSAGDRSGEVQILNIMGFVYGILGE